MSNSSGEQNSPATTWSAIPERRSCVVHVTSNRLRLLRMPNASRHGGRDVGAGAGEAATGSNESIGVNQTSTVTGLARGLPAQTVSGNFDNPNDGPVYVTSVAATVMGTDQIGCGVSHYTIAGSAAVNRTGTFRRWCRILIGLTVQFNSKADLDQDACKDAVVSITYSAN